MKPDLKVQIGELIDRGAPPVSAREARERLAEARAADGRDATPLRPRRRRVVIGGVAAGIAVAGCAAALIVLPGHPGSPGRRVGAAPTAHRVSATHPAGPTHSAAPGGHGAVFLTATTIRRLSAASRSALASSGLERITYRTVQKGAVTTYGTDVVTFSGRNWNYAVNSTVLKSGGRPAEISNGIARVVNGRFYLQGDPADAKSPWLFEASYGGTAYFPKPATALALLSPQARFQLVGWQVIGGVRLKELRATEVSGLPDNLTLSRYAPKGQSLSALAVWADQDGVVHRMQMKLAGGDGATTLTIAFSRFGQPEVITTPTNVIHGPS